MISKGCSTMAARAGVKAKQLVERQDHPDGQQPAGQAVQQQIPAGVPGAGQGGAIFRIHKLSPICARISAGLVMRYRCTSPGQDARSCRA